MDQDNNALERLAQQMLPAIEEELRRGIQAVDGQGLTELKTMLEYHMGWEGEGPGPAARGKRIRPLLSLLTTAAAGGEWQCALPAAAAIELVHNFSLIHDDIEDNSPLRRGRPTVWSRWGVAQAINAGDAMFTLAHLALLRIEETTTAAIALEAARILQKTCLHLTQGQYLDIAYEARGDLNLDAYWLMVSGKTAALIGTCTELGALAAGASPEVRRTYLHFGRTLGLAFQALDDLLGIWGDSSRTGKSAQSDLLAGKKSLPVLFGLSQKGDFARRWAQGPIRAEEVAEVASLLEADGARSYTQQIATDLTDQSLQALLSVEPQGEAGEALKILAHQLLKREI